jgi:hypothetical protein
MKTQARAAAVAQAAVAARAARASSRGFLPLSLGDIFRYSIGPGELTAEKLLTQPRFACYGQNANAITPRRGP